MPSLLSSGTHPVASAAYKESCVNDVLAPCPMNRDNSLLHPPAADLADTLHKSGDGEVRAVLSASL